MRVYIVYLNGLAAGAADPVERPVAHMYEGKQWKRIVVMCRWVFEETKVSVQKLMPNSSKITPAPCEYPWDSDKYTIGNRIKYKKT